MNYYISYKRNNVFCEIMVDAPAKKIAEHYFQNIEPKARLVSSREEKPGDWKPGIPVLKISPNELNAMHEVFLNASIDGLDFSVRTYNCLRRTGIDTVGKLLNMSEEDLLHIRNFGQKCLVEVKDVLKEYGEYLSDSLQILPPKSKHTVSSRPQMASIPEPTNIRLTPYRIALTESFVKEVEIYAADERAAQKIAEDLWSNGKINLYYDNFADRSIVSRGRARAIDLELHDVYGREYTSFSKEDNSYRCPSSKDFKKLTFSEQLQVAAAIEYKGIIFDDWQVDKDAVWAEICESCANNYMDLISGELDDGDAIGICSVSGCQVSGLDSDNKHYYIDFQPEFIHPLSREQLEAITQKTAQKKISLDKQMEQATARASNSLAVKPKELAPEL